MKKMQTIELQRQEKAISISVKWQIHLSPNEKENEQKWCVYDVFVAHDGDRESEIKFAKVIEKRN